uniref:Glutaredoxin-3 n=1 Tax=Dracunculus medinensis TaxID=318479 RepID=A0A0N4U4K7_DRAME
LVALLVQSGETLSSENFLKIFSLSIVNFVAVEWSSACQQIFTILLELINEESRYKTIRLATVDAENLPEVFHANSVNAVPTLIFFKNGMEIDRVNGFNPDELKIKLVKNSFNLVSANSTPESLPKLNELLKKLINQSRLVLFMKGTIENPKCGFSREMLNLLNELNADFSIFDVLSDETVRQGLKEYSQWQTYPQLYLDGKLVGGLDVIKEEIKDPDFVNKLPKKMNLEDRLKILIRQSRLVLFMKGVPESPKCGFSRQMVELLNSLNADFTAFDILSDEEVRQGLKKFSKWPTYPQLYLDGELIGGLDVFRQEMENETFIGRLPKCI